MDLREKKTLRSIKNAFLQLRKKKPLERITIKELTKLAEISKTTFYLHYKDIYDLSEKLQNELIENITCGITHPDYFLSDISGFTKELYYAFYSQQQLLEILFSGMQSAVLPVCIEQKIREFILKTNGHLDENRDILLTYLIQGSYHLYRKHCHKFDVEKLIHLVTVASEAALNAVEEIQ